MKAIKFLSLALLVLSLGTMLTSCSKDDDAVTLEGTWLQTYQKDVYLGDEEYYDVNNFVSGMMKWVFTSTSANNYIVKIYGYTSDSWEEWTSSTAVQNGSKLEIEDDYFCGTYEITLTETTLYVIDEEGGREYEFVKQK